MMDSFVTNPPIINRQRLSVSLSLWRDPRASLARAVCPYCGVGCVLDATLEDGKVTRISTDPAIEPNRGMMCPKGALVSSVLNDPQRIIQPMMRPRKGAPLEPVSWETAIGFIAEKITQTLETRGPDALAWYGSGQLDSEASYVFSKLFKGFLICNHTDTNSRLCMSSAVAGYTLAFGSDGPAGCYDDIEEADTFFILGANMAVNHPVLFNRVRRRRTVHTDGRIIVVDPRRTKTAEHADLHLAVKPGGDVALVQWISRKLVERGCVDHAFVQQHTQDSTAYLAHLASLDEVDLQQQCGIEPTRIERAAEMMSTPRRSLSFYCMGANQSSRGTDKNTAIINLHLLLGQVGKPGCGPFSLTGQPNAMGGREVGYLCHQLPGYRLIENAAHRREIELAWGCEPGSIDPRPGRHAVLMFEHAAKGGTAVIWIACTNPVVSMPDANTARRALEQTPLVIVQDITTRSETVAFADVLLPACLWGEKAGTMTNSERLVVRSGRFLEAPEQVRPDWWAPAQVARQMGFAGFDYTTAEEVWEEFRQLTRGRPCDITGITNDRLQQGPMRWPCADRDTIGAPRRYTDGRFDTPDGKARFHLGRLDGPAEPTDDHYPLMLTTGRVAAHWHTRTKSGLAPELSRQEPDPFVEVHPQDALRLSILDGQWCLIESRRGNARAKARITEAVAPGVVFSTFHFGAQYAADVTLNTTTNPTCDPISKQPELKACAVRISPMSGADASVNAGGDPGGDSGGVA